MKKRILPFGFLTLLILGLAAFIIVSANLNKKTTVPVNYGGQSIIGAKEYLASIRNNQHTGLLDPRDVINARQQIAAASANYKSGNGATDINWVELGPDNIGGRTRAIIFDNKDTEAKTVYAGAVTGGIFKSTNLGNNWEKVNLNSGTANLNVSCMVQSDDGTIYAGTGEGLNTENYTGYADMGFEGGFIGKGIFKSDGNDDFHLVEGTQPTTSGNTVEWAYINELALDKEGNRLFAATNNGLKYADLPNLDNWQSDCKYIMDSTIIYRSIARDSIIVCDSFEIIDNEYVIYGQSQVEVIFNGDDTTNVETVYSASTPFAEYGNCFDVKVSENGWIITIFNGYVYVSETGNPNSFVRRSIYPDNPDNIRQDNIAFNTHIIIKNKSNTIIHEANNNTNEINDWHTDYIYVNEEYSEWTGYPSSENTGRVEFAIAPSDQNVVYAMAAKSSPPQKNSLFNIYLSEDGGQSWRIIAPGGTNVLNILGSAWYNNEGDPQYFYQGDYNNTIAVFPNDPYQIIAGGVNLWHGKKEDETGFYAWQEKSIGITNLPGGGTIFNGIFNIVYCHVDHHTYVFRPGFNNEFFVGTDGGVYYGNVGPNIFIFYMKNKNYNATQYYSLDISNRLSEAIGGTQDNGTQYISGEGNSPKSGGDMWRPANLDPKYPEGTDGGYSALSNIRTIFKTLDDNNNIVTIDEIAPPSYYSKSSLPKSEALIDRIRRSETLGYDYSANFLDDPALAPTNVFTSLKFLSPMILWENYDNENSRDSVTVNVDEDYLTTYKIVTNEETNTTDTIYYFNPYLYARSNNLNHPFHFFDYNEYFDNYEPNWDANNNFVPDTLFHQGESFKVKDLISTKLFVGALDEIWMTLDAVRFDVVPEWYLISDDSHNGFEDNPNCMAYSADANYLFVGNLEGKLYRISNIALAYNKDLADVGSSNCIIATDELEIAEGNTQAVTSIAVDPKDANNVLVTLGNYGNTDYVYYCTNALGDTPVFHSVQENLPQMPVYSSLIEMRTDTAFLGTEEGIWMTDNINANTVVWYDASNGFGKVPVMSLKQQTVYKSEWTITVNDPATGIPTWEIFSEIKNYGVIYAATHGRGIFRLDSPPYVGIEEEPAISNKTSNKIELAIYPNPASDNINVSFNLTTKSDVSINIYDLSGKLVQSKSEGSLNKGKQDVSLNINSLTRGTYIARIIAGNKTGTSKLIIIK